MHKKEVPKQKLNKNQPHIFSSKKPIDINCDTVWMKSLVPFC